MTLIKKKGHVVDTEKIFANCLSDQGLVSGIYENSKNSIRDYITSFKNKLVSFKNYKIMKDKKKKKRPRNFSRLKRDNN